MTEFAQLVVDGLVSGAVHADRADRPEPDRPPGRHLRELGIGLAGSYRPGEYAELAAAAEGAGFDVFSVFGDLMFRPPIPALLMAAQATRRIRLGPAAMNPYTTHPAEIAGQVAFLDLVSSGRAYLGLARGAWLERLQVSQPRPAEAIRDAAETIVDEDGERARGRARTEVAMYVDVVGALDPTRPIDPELLARVHELAEADRHEDAGKLIPDEVLDRFALAGTPDQVAERAPSSSPPAPRGWISARPSALTDRSRASGSSSGGCCPLYADHPQPTKKWGSQG